LFQWVSLKAYRSFHGLDDSSRFLYWCRRIASNAWADMCRHAARTTDILDDEDLWDGRDYAAEVVERTALRKALQQFLADLGEEKRYIFLARVEGIPAKEVAEELQMPPALVDTIFHRAKARGRRTLREWIEQGAVVVGAIVPARVRAALRRLGNRVAAAARRLESSGAAPFALAIVVAGTLASGVAVGVASQPRFRRPHVPASLGLTSARPSGAVHGAGEVGRRASTRTAGSPTASAGANDALFRRNDCGFVLQCEAGPSRILPVVGDQPNTHDAVIPIWIPGQEDLWIDLTVHPGQLPSSASDLELQFLGRRDALACDSQIISTGHTCDRRDVVGLALFILETNREGAVGGVCAINEQRGTHIPVVCDPIPVTLVHHGPGVLPVR
jgi:RNA polymerase sigma-70 factor (ECF subfamily)